MIRATTEQIIAAYKETGSVWRAAERLGMCGQSVHERLRCLDYPMPNMKWTTEEKEKAVELAIKGVSISKIASRLGRPYAGVACQLSALKIKHPYRTPKKVKRGLGLTKPRVLAFAKYILSTGKPVTVAAREQGMSTTSLVSALQQKAPEMWAEYIKKFAKYPPRICEGCGAEFVPLNARQRACDNKCSANARADKEYFGGKRRNTIGLAEGICQLCSKANVVGLSSHHVFGKENDADNDVLIALCRGCHHLVGMLGKRTKVTDPAFWENLIHLAVARKQGDKHIMSGGTYVTVEIEMLTPEEVEDCMDDIAGAPRNPCCITDDLPF